MMTAQQIDSWSLTRAALTQTLRAEHARAKAQGCVMCTAYIQEMMETAESWANRLDCERADLNPPFSHPHDSWRYPSHD